MTPLPQDDAFQVELTELMLEVMRSTHLTEGKMAKALEEEVSKHTGLHAVAVSSCGSGLFALAHVLGSKHAVVPTNTFYATGGMFRHAGYSLSLADCAPDRFSCGIDQIKAAASHGASVVVLTHVGGKTADDYIEIAKWCDSKGITLIEDAAHALGVPGIGLLGDAAVFSLYPTKAVPAGEGGIVVSKDEHLIEAVRVFGNYGKWLADGEVRYTLGGGFNLRMDEWTAAVALVQMQRLKEIILLRQDAAAQLMRLIPAHPEFRFAWSNWYKAPTYRSLAEELGFERLTGQIYATSDQLTCSIFGDMPPLPNAAKLAEDHVCLPIGERLYEGKSTDEIAAWLRKEIEW